jgi:hypothetical protein
MLFSLVLSAALAQPAQEPAAPGGLPPQQALAIIDGEGTLKIVQISCACDSSSAQETMVDVFEIKGTERVPAKVKVKVSTLMLTTVELPAKYVEAYTVEGAPIAREKLAEMLAKERTVLVAMDGKKVDPFHLQLYKAGAIVLVPPANLMGGGGVSFVGGAVGVPVTPIPLPPGPIDRPKPLPDEKKP